MRLLMLVALACDPPAPPARPAETPKPAKVVPPPIARPPVPQHIPTATAAHGAPVFVTRGSGVFEDGGKPAFFGLGKTKGTENRKLAHTLADQSADAELGKLLAGVNAKALALAKKRDEKALEQLAADAVAKAAIVDHWIDHDEDHWYSLKKIDVAPYVDAVGAALALDDSAKAALSGR
jgi:hypothetical protein